MIKLKISIHIYSKVISIKTAEGLTVRDWGKYTAAEKEMVWLLACTTLVGRGRLHHQTTLCNSVEVSANKLVQRLTLYKAA